MWAAISNKRSTAATKDKDRDVFSRVMLGVFTLTQFGIIYGTVRMVLFFDLPPASSITILMEMVSVISGMRFSPNSNC